MDSAESVEAILSAWELDQLTPAFLEQEISLHMLETIDGELLKELIPKIGQRMKFLEKRKEFFLNKSQNVGEHSMSLEPQSLSGCSIQAQRPVSTATTATTTSSSVSAMKSVASSSQSASTSSFVKQVAARFCLNKFIADIDINAVCGKHITADAAIQFYAKNSILTGTNQTAIVDALMTHLYTHARDFGCTDRLPFQESPEFSLESAYEVREKFMELFVARPLQWQFNMLPDVSNV
ncbi:uncharacterized protein LOC117650721 [Thrips palmi]|uniref:Uncharacterized protein LOC117650721 n=1 Tax=Thrips palmi TaxID=161013 RepID=A0A6P8ZXR7_THRPL|nr:uncharacterized protein LOC117650721 [Thrips palmi]